MFRTNTYHYMYSYNVMILTQFQLRIMSHTNYLISLTYPDVHAAIADGKLLSFKQN